MSCVDCGQSHESQRREYPVGSEVELLVTIKYGDQVVLGEGSIGKVIGHAEDGRAKILFDGAVHTFHYPESCLQCSIDDETRSRILSLTRLDLRRGRRDIPMETISLRDLMIADRRINCARLIYIYDDGQHAILKNQNGSMGVVSEEDLLVEAEKIYGAGSRSLYEVLEMVKGFLDYLPDEMVDPSVADAVSGALAGENGGNNG